MNFILIIGLGSIGKRHLNNLIALGYNDIAIVNRSGNLPEGYAHFPVFTDLQKALNENVVTHAFVCTPTACHIADFQLLLDHHVDNIYIEKPVSHDLDSIETVKNISNSKRIVVGYDLHFDPGLQKIKTIIDDGKLGKIFSFNAIVGQYLPDWRPGQDHKKGMSASVEKGGGVMLDLIHEFDYIRWFAGKPERIACMTQHNPNLEIETEDVADALLQFEGNISATIHLDYHQRSVVRNCMITAEEGTVFWNLASSEVNINIAGSPQENFSYKSFERNDRFLSIVKAFMDNSFFDARLTTFEEGLISLKMVDAAKRSAATKSFTAINPEK